MTNWIRGKIPKYSDYKKISVDEEELMNLAKEGAKVAYAYFGARLYFTQAVFFGASISEKYNHVAGILPSQYGKSYVQALASVYFAFKGEKVNLGAKTSDNNIAKKIPEILLDADDEIKKRATIAFDQFEKLNQKLSKDGIGFSNGGEVRVFSFGSNFRSKGSNQAVGLEGQYLVVDESALVGEEFDEGFSRVLKKNEKTGKRGTVVEISNPHKGGRFENFMKKKKHSEHEFCVWAGEEILLSEKAETPEGLALRYPDKKARAYRINIAGEFLANEGLIYSDWKKLSRDDKNVWHTVLFGLDFGFGHPTALVEILRNEHETAWLFRERLYRTHMTPAEIVSEVKSICGQHNVVCDTARPEIINDLKTAGINAIDANKNTGSVARGIGEVQDLSDVFYEGENLEDEYLSYEWKKKADGSKVDEPVKANDDAMDALRYGVDKVIAQDKLKKELNNVDNFYDDIDKPAVNYADDDINNLRNGEEDNENAGFYQ